MRKLVDIVSLFMIIIILLAISTSHDKANFNNYIQSYQSTQIEAVCDIYEGKKGYFLVTTTGYYPGPECCHPFADGITAIGYEAKRGVIAIDDKNGPFKMGDIVYVEGYGYGLCCDRGSAIKDWKADLCFDTLEEAEKWGVKLSKIWKVN